MKTATFRNRLALLTLGFAFALPAAPALAKHHDDRPDRPPRGGAAIVLPGVQVRVPVPVIPVAPAVVVAPPAVVVPGRPVAPPPLPPPPVVNGALRDAARALSDDSASLEDAVQSVYEEREWPRDERLRAVRSFRDSASSFYSSSQTQSPDRLNDDYDALRDNYNRLKDNFDGLPRSRRVDDRVDALRASMSALTGAYDRARSGPDRLGMAREIENAAAALRDKARDLMDRRDVRARPDQVDDAYERIKGLLRQASDLRHETETRDWEGMRGEYRSARGAWRGVGDVKWVFGNDLDGRYARLGGLLDRFGDTMR